MPIRTPLGLVLALGAAGVLTAPAVADERCGGPIRPAAVMTVRACDSPATFALCRPAA